MTDKVEQVARAICAADTTAPEPDEPIYKGMKRVAAWEGRIEMARAAIEAMREPTPKQLLVGGQAASKIEPDRLRRFGLPAESYRAMIDAALDPAKE